MSKLIHSTNFPLHHHQTKQHTFIRSRTHQNSDSSTLFTVEHFHNNKQSTNCLALALYFNCKFASHWLSAECFDIVHSSHDDNNSNM